MPKNKIFIDCGFFVGTVIREYANWGIIDDTWDIYAFEPNPELDIKEYLKTIPVKVKMSKKAVWTTAGVMSFNVTENPNASSLHHDGGNVIEVKTMDFSKFVADLPDDAYIICNMDIEGSEYPVLEKMLEEHTIDKIKFLDVEFHHRLLPDKTMEDSQRLTRAIMDRGVVIRPKVPFI